jgi:hypothetical protein
MLLCKVYNIQITGLSHLWKFSARLEVRTLSRYTTLFHTNVQIYAAETQVLSLDFDNVTESTLLIIFCW